MLSGGRFCVAIRYEAGGTPFHETNCHCSICRRTPDGPFAKAGGLLRGLVGSSSAALLDHRFSENAIPRERPNRETPG